MTGDQTIKLTTLAKNPARHMIRQRKDLAAPYRSTKASKLKCMQASWIFARVCGGTSEEATSDIPHTPTQRQIKVQELLSSAHTSDAGALILSLQSSVIKSYGLSTVRATNNKSCGSC